MSFVKRLYLTVGLPVEHRKKGTRGEVVALKATGTRQQKYQIKWENGLTTWVDRKEIKVN